jgi:hypothetical protein
MFGYDDDPPETKPVDYAGLKIGLALLPVFFLFAFLGNAEMGLTVSIVLALIIVAIRMSLEV